MCTACFTSTCIRIHGHVHVLIAHSSVHFLMHRTRSLLRADRVLQNQGEKSNRIFDLPRRGLVRMLACSRMRACHTEKAAASACFMPGLAVSNHKFSSSG